MKAVKFTIAAIAATIAAGALHAAEPPKATPFIEADLNGDDYVSREEAIAHATKRFDRADSNSDGQIDREEAKEGRKERKEKRKERRERPEQAGEAREGRGFRAIDANGDGAVTKEELTAFRAARNGGNQPGEAQEIDTIFSKLDANGDGQISLEEFRARRR